MDIVPGRLYFVSDDFFKNVNDPFLKINYDHTKRPHYFAFKDATTDLYWLVPYSSKADKFEEIIRKRAANKKPTDGIKIVTIQNRKNALLFQDMFPITERYIEAPYVRGGQDVRIADPKVIHDLEKNARKVVSLIRHGVRFTPTQPDSRRIETLMLDELNGVE